jgi:transposase
MVYREHGMWEVLEVLRRAHRGEGRRAIARTTGRSRKTVQRYLTAAAALGWQPGQREPDEALAAQILAQLRPGVHDRAPSEAAQRLLPHRETLRGWLSGETTEGRPLTLTKCHDLLTRRGVTVTYSSLYRFAVKHAGLGDRLTTVRMAAVAPGELAEIDFGRLGLIPDGRLDRRRVLWALVITLVHSRHQYVHLTHSQTLAEVLGGLEDAWTFFGGVPARVVVDNLRAAIAKADRYDPVFARVFDEYSQYRGFVIDPAPPGMPTGKPHVERQVPYVRERFFRGETFLDRDHAQREVIRWLVDTAGRRLHGTTRQRPLEVFETVERAALRPLEGERFDPPRWARVKVHPDHHIRFGQALYSVPHRYLRQAVDVRGDTKLVRIYHRGELVKTCPTQPPGGRHTDYTDYPAEQTAYAMRDPQAMIDRATRHGPNLGAFMTRLLDGTFPWAKLRQAQKLLRLVDRYGGLALEAACRRALGFELVNVHRVEQIVLRGLERDEADAPPAGGRLIQGTLRFLRPPNSFVESPTTTTTQEDPDGHQ